MVFCYYRSKDNPGLIRQINHGVCADSGSATGHYSCCWPWDECLPNPLCWSTTQPLYYTATCTDQTLQDSACQKGCNGVYLDNLTYNSTSNSWACCSPDTECSTTFNETLDAPAPELLRQQTMAILDFIPTSTSSRAASTGTLITESTASLASSTATSDPVPSETSSLSSGAKAGIGVGVAVGVIAIIAAVVVILLRRNKRKGPQPMLTDETENTNKNDIHGKDGSQLKNASRDTPQYATELTGAEVASEMAVREGRNHRPQELSA